MKSFRYCNNIFLQKENVQNGTDDRPEKNSLTEVDVKFGMPEVNSVADGANTEVGVKFGMPKVNSVADRGSNALGDHKNERPELISVADGATNAGGVPVFLNTNNSNNFGTKRKHISKDNSQGDEPFCKSIKTTEALETVSATQPQFGVDDECDAFHIRVINKNLSGLLTDLDPLPTLDAFLENEYITEIKARDIRDSKIRSEQIRAILDIVKRKGPNGYDTFKSCLRKSDQEHLAVALENTEMELTNELRTVAKASTSNANNEV